MSRSKNKSKKNRRAKRAKEKILIGIPLAIDCLMNVAVAGFCCLQTKRGRDWKAWCSHRPECGRNGIISEYFLPSDYTHIFFLDSDVVPQADAIDRLLLHDKPIVAGVYPRQHPGGGIRWSAIKDNQSPPVQDNLIEFDKLPAEPFETTCVGGSTVLIKREVFENIKYPWYYFKHANGDFGPMSEDLVFSLKARKHGYTLWVDPSVRCDHYKTINIRRYGLVNQRY